MLSQTSEYALRAVLFLAEKNAGEPVGVDVIAEAIGIPESYLSKTLQALAKTGVLRSTRGRRGGFALAVPPDELMLARVIGPFEDDAAHRHCLLGRRVCSDRTACAAHHAWKATSDRIVKFFGTTSVAQVQGPVAQLGMGRA
jgi:Rrf2 family protein